MQEILEGIIVDPDICNGKPVVKGTRITVQTVLEHLSAGDTVDDLIKYYPSLKKEDIKLCLDGAAKLFGLRTDFISLKSA
jgi:uncharacterized protein (DUF433 family)